VESVIGEEIGSPLEAVYGGMVLGSADFVKGILARIKNETLKKGEVSGRRELNSATTMEEVVEEVARHFKANRQAIFEESGNVLKKVAMYLIKRHSGVTNGQIGELFNLSYSGVAQVYRRFSKQLEEDKILKHDIARIASRLYQVKG
jgi:chromosomal replication initiation ATPase DnaA